MDQQIDILEDFDQLDNMVSFLRIEEEGHIETEFFRWGNFLWTLTFICAELLPLNRIEQTVCTDILCKTYFGNQNG